VPKKEELKKLIRGKGLSAFRPSAENLASDNKTSKIPDSTIPDESAAPDRPTEPSSEVIIESTSPQQPPQKRVNQYCVISECLPSEKQQTRLQNIFEENPHQIIIWDAFISQPEQLGSVFKQKIPLTFNVFGSAGGMLAQLKPLVTVHWISYDLLRMQLQPCFEFRIQTKPWWPSFKISYDFLPAVSGFFKFHTILDISQVDLFEFYEGSIFKIG